MDTSTLISVYVFAGWVYIAPVVFGILAPIKLKFPCWTFCIFLSAILLVGFAWEAWLGQYCGGDAMKGYYCNEPWVREYFNIQAIGTFCFFYMLLYTVLIGPIITLVVIVILFRRYW